MADGYTTGPGGDVTIGGITLTPDQVKSFQGALPTKPVAMAPGELATPAGWQSQGGINSPPPTDPGKGGGGKGGGGGSGGSTDVGSFETALQGLFAPFEQQASGAVGEYNQVLGQLGQIHAPGGSTSGPNAAVNQAIGEANAAQSGYTQAMQQGAQGMASVAGQLPTAISSQVAGLPYQDVLSTLLQSRKNQLLYGTAPTTQVSTSGNWSQNMQDIYKYLQGTLGAGSPLTGGADTVGSPASANTATQNATVGSGAGVGGVVGTG